MGGLSLCLLAACSPVVPAGSGPTPNQVLAGARSAFANETAYHLKGTWTDGGIPITVDADVAGTTEQQGTATTAAGTLVFLGAGNATYVKGSASVIEVTGDVTMPAVVGDRWLLTPHAGPVASLRKLIANFASAFLEPLKAPRQSTVVNGGATSIKVNDRHESVELAAALPHLPQHIERDAKAPSVNGLTSASLSISAYNEPLDIVKPADFLDPDNLSTWPARYTPSAPSVGFDGCDVPTFCGGHITVKNLYGHFAPAQVPVATFSFKEAAGSEVGSCSVEIPLLAAGAEDVVRCRLSDATWGAFVTRVRSGSAKPSLIVTVAVSNPTYGSAA